MTLEKLIIREAQPEDANDVLIFLKTITKETDNLLLTPEESNKMKLTDEISFLKESLESSSSIFLLAIKNEKIIGTASMQTFIRSRISHRGTFGMSVLKEYRSNGVGSQLLLEIIQYAKYINLELLELEVRTDNVAAIALYKKFGFKEYGLYKNFMKIDNNYYDGTFMLLNLKELIS